MLLAPTWRVDADAVLARAAISHAQGFPQPLLTAGRTLAPSLAQALFRSDVDWVYVMSDLAEGIDPGPAIPAEVTDSLRCPIEDLFLLSRRRRQRIPAGKVEALFPAIDDLVAHLGAWGPAPLSHDPTRVAEDQVSHAIGVALIGLAIALRTTYRDTIPGDARLARLGAGLLLHDVGATAIPPDVVSITGPLNEMQIEVVRWHPNAGADIVADSELSSLVTATVVQHHERHDGTGYPEGLAGDDIHPHAEIAAVADAYDALAARSIAVSRRPGDTALRVVRRWSGTAFAPAVAEALEEVVAPFPPCCPVLLSDGSRGIVVTNTSGHPHRPIVRVTHGPEAEPLVPGDIDLSEHARAHVVRALDHPGAPLDAAPPTRSGHAPPSLAIRGLEAAGLLNRLESAQPSS